jgi:hypothetical protein
MKSRITEERGLGAASLAEWLLFSQEGLCSSYTQTLKDSLEINELYNCQVPRISTFRRTPISAVGIATGYGLVDGEVGVQIPVW